MATTTRLTQDLARILRGELAKANRNQAWFGSAIGRSQSHASQVLQGNKSLSMDELQKAATAFGVKVSDLLAAAEGGAAPLAMPSDPRGAIRFYLAHPDKDETLIAQLSEALSHPGIPGFERKHLETEIRQTRQRELTAALAALPTGEVNNSA